MVKVKKEIVHNKTESMILLLLLKEGKSNATEIATLIGKDRGNVTKKLKHLCKEGYVNRKKRNNMQYNIIEYEINYSKLEELFLESVKSKCNKLIDNIERITKKVSLYNEITQINENKIYERKVLGKIKKLIYYKPTKYDYIFMSKGRLLAIREKGKIPVIYNNEVNIADVLKEMINDPNKFRKNVSSIKLNKSVINFFDIGVEFFTERDEFYELETLHDLFISIIMNSPSNQNKIPKEWVKVFETIIFDVTGSEKSRENLLKEIKKSLQKPKKKLNKSRV